MAKRIEDVSLDTVTKMCENLSIEDLVGFIHSTDPSGLHKGLCNDKLLEKDLTFYKKRGTTYFSKLVKQNDINGVKVFLDAGQNPNSKIHGQSALSYASKNNLIDIVSLLIKAGANINRIDDADGHTPLAYAVKNGSIDITLLLIKAGANVNQNIHGRTLLAYAVEIGSIDIIHLLIKSGANINVPNNDLIEIALTHNPSIEIFEILLGIKANIGNELLIHILSSPKFLFFEHA